MKSLTIAQNITTTNSAAVDAESTPFHAGNQVVAMVHISHSGTVGSRGWTIQGNNQPEGVSAVWEDLSTEVLDAVVGVFTITMPRQIRLENSTAGAGSKAADLHLIG